MDQILNNYKQLISAYGDDAWFMIKNINRATWDQAKLELEKDKEAVKEPSFETLL